GLGPPVRSARRWHRGLPEALPTIARFVRWALCLETFRVFCACESPRASASRVACGRAVSRVSVPRIEAFHGSATALRHRKGLTGTDWFYATKTRGGVTCDLSVGGLFTA